MDRFQKYRDAAIEGIRELEKLTTQKIEIESQISTLVQLIAGNIAILPASERSNLGMRFEAARAPSGMTDAVMRTLSFKEWRSAAQVREALIKSGYDLSTQVNPLASIHTTLRRLANDGRVETKEDEGRSVYRRRGMPPPRLE